MKRVVVQATRKAYISILGRGGDPVGIIELCIIVVEVYSPLVGVSCDVITGVEEPRLEEICLTIFKGIG